MQKLRTKRTCDYCKDVIRKDGRVKIRENGKVRFILDIGCSLLIGAREVIKIKGQRYKIIYK